MIILGLNAYHADSAACLVVDGQLVGAAEEERFRRVKHWAGFPTRAIEYVLREARLSLGDVQHIAINSDPKANFLRKAWYGFRTRPDLRLVVDRLRNAKQRVSIAETLAKEFPGQTCRATIHHIEHHFAHAGSSFFVCPFDEAVVVSVDGFGDFASAAWGVGKGTDLRLDGKVYFPHSLGIFYQALTQFLGFPHYGDEYKVMGLAPYGTPVYSTEMQQLVLLQEDGSFQLALDYFRHHNEKVEYRWDGGLPFIGQLYHPRLEDLLGPCRKEGDPLDQRHKDLARSIQWMYEEALFHLLTRLHQRYQLDSLALAGGCGMNSVANGKVYAKTPFKRLYVQSAAGDAGGAIGAAYSTWANLTKGRRHFVMDHAYWGPQFGNSDIEALLQTERSRIDAARCQIALLPEEQLVARTAQAIADGLVVGWFQGRLEWGPRALGNRSILGDPRRADMKDILNLKIKRRESFRPFAPSIVREAVSDWFETEDEVPFMMKVFQIREPKRGIIPAVTHVDGSGRLQTVRQEANPRYHRLIRAFESLTGVPIVLNTSFNENEPVVCQPREALDCFLRTRMDVLVLGDHFISRIG